MSTVLIVTMTTTVYSATDGGAPETTTTVEADRAAGLLSIDDVAAYLGVSVRWVYTQVRSGALPAMLIARSWRIRPEALEEFAASFRSG